MGGILDEDESELIAYLSYLPDLYNLSGKINRNDGLGLRCDMSPDTVGLDIVYLRIDIRKYRSPSEITDTVSRCCKC